MLAAIVLVLPTVAVPGPTPWDRLFLAAGTTAAKVQVPATKWRGGGRYELPVFDACWDDWRLLEPNTLDMARRLRSCDPLTGLRTATTALARAKAPEPPRPRLSLRQAIVACGAGDPDGRLEAAVRKVPRDVAIAAATVLAAMPEVDRLRRAAVDPLADLGTPDRLAGEALAFAKSYDLQSHSLALVDRFDVGPMLRASTVLARATRDGHCRRLRNRAFDFAWPTPLGRIELHGGAGAIHSLDGALLVIDTASKSTFVATRPISSEQAVVSVGDGASFTDCGLAAFGVSHFLAAGRGNRWLCQGSGEGAAVFGVSIVEDGGSSTFDGRDLTQGAAVDGAALLLVSGSHNKYRCHSISQGFAGPKGFGALVDLGGGSDFDADDTKIDNPSPQTSQHNVSMAQGAGFGRRADPGDGHSMAGGVGILVEGGSHNRYSCGVFGQGVAYWYSVGALVDFGGDNQFKGVWYVQGSAAHYALACQLEFGAHDRFEATTAQCLGQGHDYSIGLLHCFKGGSDFRCDGSGAFGSGRWNGIGFFAAAGDNHFLAGPESYGFAADHRAAESCFGFFAAPGHNVIGAAAKGIGAGNTWFQQRQDKPLVLGIGFAGR